MHDDDSSTADPSEASAKPEELAAAPAATSAKSEGEAASDWVGAAGVSGDFVIAPGETPRLQWALMILGPIGLAVAIVLSLWSSGRQVERSVNVQVESRWQPGEQLGLRTQIFAGDLRPLAGETRVDAALIDAGGRRFELGALTAGELGLAQGTVAVPADAQLGAGELVLEFSPPAASKLEPFEERAAVELVEERADDGGEQVVSKHMLQWADDTDEQPEGVRIDLRPDGRLLAGFDNRVFVRVTDPAGKPWAPKQVPAQVQVRLITGEFGEQLGTLDDAPVLYEGPLDRFGLASVSGVLRSDVVRFEVRLPKDEAPAPDEGEAGETGEEGETGEAGETGEEDELEFEGPKRRLRFVSHAGTVRVHPSKDYAAPGETVSLIVEAISSRRPVYVDVHGPRGAWIDTMTPPVVVPQEREWTIPESLAAPSSKDAGRFVQFEAYQSILNPEDSSAIARVQVATGDRTARATLAPLVEGQREQLDLPRVDKEFEIGRERTYLSFIEKQLGEDHEVSAEELARVRAFLIGSLEAVVHGPPQALNTRAREEQTVAAFKRRWVITIRWFLLGGGLLFILVMTVMVVGNQRRFEGQTNQALVEDGVLVDEEILADQSLAIIRARRQILVRGVLTVALMVAALLLTVAMLESLVWEY